LKKEVNKLYGAYKRMTQGRQSYHDEELIYQAFPTTNLKEVYRFIADRYWALDQLKELQNGGSKR